MNSLDQKSRTTFFSTEEMDRIREYSNSNHITFGYDQVTHRVYFLFKTNPIRTFDEMLENIKLVSDTFVEGELKRSSQMKKSSRGYCLYIGEKK